MGHPCPKTAPAGTPRWRRVRVLAVRDQRTFCTSPPIPSVTRSPIEAAVSTTAPAARLTRFTAPLLPPSELPPPPDEARLRDDFLADDFRAEVFRPDDEDFRADDFFAEDFRAADLEPPRAPDDFLAVERFAVDFLAVDRFAVDRFAVERFAEDFLAEDFFAPPRFADDFFAEDFRPDDFRAPPVFDEAEAPDAREVRRAVPLLREDFRVDVPPEDFDRVAIGVAPVLRRCAPRVRKN